MVTIQTIQAHTRRRAHSRVQRPAQNGRLSKRPCAAAGQTLVECALVLPVFVLVTIGLLDGLRVVLFYAQVQEAARQGARWGAVQVGRAVDSAGTHTVGGTFGDQGNAPGTYCSTCAATVAGSRALPDGTTTIVGAATRAMTGVTLTQATVTISTTISPGVTETLQTYNDRIANKAVSVSVAYPFKPLLGMVFGGVTITMRGTSTMLHE